MRAARGEHLLVHFSNQVQHLFRVGELGTAWLGVEVFIPEDHISKTVQCIHVCFPLLSISVSPLYAGFGYREERGKGKGKGKENTPLDCPLHSLITDEKRNGPVEDLTLGPSVDVEDGGVCGTGKRTLAVVGKGVGDNALLRRGA